MDQIQFYKSYNIYCNFIQEKQIINERKTKQKQMKRKKIFFKSTFYLI